MSGVPSTIVGLGEVLWDVLPDERHLGGAPANFACHVTALGARGIVASRVGRAAEGDEIVRRLLTVGVATDFIQRDDKLPTGAVYVRLDAMGRPSYDIVQPVAWDRIAWTKDYRQLATHCDAVCWGTLAQRADESCDTILRFVRATNAATLRIFDVNLRQGFYTPSLLNESLRLAHIVKLNDEELPRVAAVITGENDLDTKLFSDVDDASNVNGLVRAARSIVERCGVAAVCVTRGARGALFVNADDVIESEGVSIEVADTIGAGDAFTAALVVSLLRGDPTARALDRANRLGAWVASQHGATPPLDDEVRRRIIDFGED